MQKIGNPCLPPDTHHKLQDADWWDQTPFMIDSGPFTPMSLERTKLLVI